jgi:acyl-CoA thioesterase I
MELNKVVQSLLLLVTMSLSLAACDRGTGEKRKEVTIPSQNPTATANNEKTIRPGPITYVALGDSTGAGVGAREGGYPARLFRRLLNQRPGSKLVNFSVSGATTTDVLKNQLDRGLRADPQLITLGIGINDIGHGFTVKQFADNYDQILKRLRANSQAPIVISNIPDISSSQRVPPALRESTQQVIIQFNQRLAEIASTHGATVIDVYAVTHEQLPKHPEYFSADGFHPSDQGYELWADAVWPTIARMAGRE